MKKNRRVKIITCDDDNIQSTMLDYADAREYWYEHEDVFGGCNFVSDVLDWCSCVDIESETWDAGFPGRSGITYTMRILDGESLKEEIRNRLKKLAEPAPIPPPQPPPSGPTIYDNIEQIARFLKGEAVSIARCMDLPGYTGMNKYSASVLSNAAKSLEEETRDDDGVRAEWH